MKKSIFALLLVGMLIISSPTWSASSFNDVQQRAESGDAKAQLELGYRYFQGNETARDVEKALRWFQRAAQQGYTPAEYVMGLRYANGEGVAQDYAQAAQWYRKAAVKGLPQAQQNLAVLYQCLISDAPMSAIFLFRSSMVACVSVM